MKFLFSLCHILNGAKFINLFIFYLFYNVLAEDRVQDDIKNQISSTTTAPTTINGIVLRPGVFVYFTLWLFYNNFIFKVSKINFLLILSFKLIDFFKC